MDELTRLADKYGTDKGSVYHRYTSFYDEVLSPIKNDKLKFVEIGVWFGESIKMWRDYLPNSTIYALDYVESNATSKHSKGPGLKHAYNLDRVTPCIVDQSSRSDIARFVELYGNSFDVILDDGGHLMNQQQISFGTFFPHVSPGGMYILEDLHTSLDHSKNFETSTIEVIRSLDKNNTVGVTAIYMTEEEIQYIEENVESVHLFSGNGSSWTSVIMKK